VDLYSTKAGCHKDGGDTVQRSPNSRVHLDGGISASSMTLVRTVRRLLSSWANGVTRMSWPPVLPTLNSQPYNKITRRPSLLFIRHSLFAFCG